MKQIAFTWLLCILSICAYAQPVRSAVRVHCDDAAAELLAFIKG